MGACDGRSYANRPFGVIERDARDALTGCTATAAAAAAPGWPRGGAAPCSRLPRTSGDDAGRFGPIPINLVGRAGAASGSGVSCSSATRCNAMPCTLYGSQLCAHLGFGLRTAQHSFIQSDFKAAVAAKAIPAEGRTCARLSCSWFRSELLRATRCLGAECDRARSEMALVIRSCRNAILSGKMPCNSRACVTHIHCAARAFGIHSLSSAAQRSAAQPVCLPF